MPLYEYACREGDYGIENSLRGTLVEDQRKKTEPPPSSTVSTLIGATEATVREKVGPPQTVVGPRWEYEASSGTGDMFFVYFVDGKVASVRPDNLPLNQVVRGK